MTTHTETRCIICGRTYDRRQAPGSPTLGNRCTDYCLDCNERDGD